MNKKIKSRIKKEAQIMLHTHMSVREIAEAIKVSKSTVHKDLRHRLKKIDLSLYEKIEKILDYHTQVRHIRGGESTKLKYKNKEEIR